MDSARRRLLKTSLALGLAATTPAFAAPRIERTTARTRSGRILGLRSEAVEETLGFSFGPLVHADDLALAQHAQDA